jgi:hypothetical protein
MNAMVRGNDIVTMRIYRYRLFIIIYCLLLSSVFIYLLLSNRYYLIILHYLSITLLHYFTCT